jgi:hypothetical protein
MTSSLGFGGVVGRLEWPDSLLELFRLEPGFRFLFDAFSSREPAPTSLENAPGFCFDAFSSREPASTLLENALRPVDPALSLKEMADQACSQPEKEDHHAQSGKRRHQSQNGNQDRTYELCG